MAAWHKRSGAVGTTFPDGDNLGSLRPFLGEGERSSEAVSSSLSTLISSSAPLEAVAAASEVGDSSVM